jgi:nucleoside-diphosphate-sugar epimerase
MDTEVCETDYLSAVDLFYSAAKAGVGLLLFASSSEVYGKFPQDRLPMKENDRFTPDTVYGWAKFGAELMLDKICKETGMTGVSARYFNVYGPGQTLNGYCVPSFIDFALNDKDILIHGDGFQTRDLTYLDDAINATLSIANYKSGNQIFNVGTQTEVTMLGLAKIILDLTKSRSKIVFIEPRRPTDLYHKMGDSTKLLNTTGIKPETNLIEGLNTTIRYYQEKRK